jgi:hypothetical protein
VLGGGPVQSHSTVRQGTAWHSMARHSATRIVVRPVGTYRLTVAGVAVSPGLLVYALRLPAALHHTP